MKRFGTVLGVLFLTLVVLVGVLRVALGWLVATEAAKTLANSLLERAVHSVLPTLTTELKGVELKGIADLELLQVRILSSHKADAALVLERTRISPQWATLFEPIWAFDIATLVEGDGRLTLVATVPRSLFFGASTAIPAQADLVQINGSMVHVDAVKLAGLLFSDQAAPGFYLSQGLISATVTWTHPVVSPRQDHLRVGRLVGKLEAPEWTLTDEAPRQLQTAPIDLNLELSRGKVLLRQPVVIAGRSGRADITGALVLPRQSLDEEGWSLVVNIADDSGLSKSLAKLFKCKNTPTNPRFAIKGTVSDVHCPAAF